MGHRTDRRILLRLFKASGATQAQLDEVARDMARWGRGSTSIEVTETGGQLLRIPAPSVTALYQGLLIALARIIREPPARGVLVDEIGAKVFSAFCTPGSTRPQTSQLPAETASVDRVHYDAR